MRYKYTKDKLQEIVVNSRSIAEVLRKLGIKAVGGNYKTMHSKLKQWDINTSHFSGQGWNVGLGFKPNPIKPLSEIMVKDSSYQSHKLKLRLLREGLKEHKCECCGLEAWQNHLVPLELHHVNGDRFDNRGCNLQLLCPNCHAMTNNYRGKNIGLLKK